jgi:hypothetical protein
MSGDDPSVMACGFVSPRLRGLGEEEIIDELRAIVSDDSGTTAYLTFSSQMRPSLHQFRVYGPRNGLLLDENNQALIRLPGRRFKSYGEHFLSPLLAAREYVSNIFHNGRRFVANEFHLKDGNRVLIEKFYNSVTQRQPVPIPYREIILVSRIMDTVFEQLNRRQPELAEIRSAGRYRAGSRAASCRSDSRQGAASGVAPRGAHR